ncbi:MAG: DNA gyrase subunit A [Flavobacteriales bacterium]|jgi:DNA gyrase subunit A
MSEPVQDVALHEATEKRYLNYALSVITARALPDVRDGLKPVQRRILYAMMHNLNLQPDGKFRKSAAVVGEVMAKYHPHGDQSIYDAMVRMAQDFSLRYPLVNGQGNYGSLDGDRAAAMRYTESKLRHIAVELLSELKKDTVHERQNYDGTISEPVVLPAQVPNLLINGASGIAVGMATNIPPHNLKEVIKALLLLIDEPDTSLERLVSRKFIPGPDFPTGGEILNSREELTEIYRIGRGPVEMRGTYEIEEDGRLAQVIITSIPYGLNKATLIGDIADHIRQGKVPQLVDIRDESTDEIRIVMELRKGAIAEAAMAYLMKRTALQSRFNVNLTALCPTDDPDVCAPKQLGLVEILQQFLTFRFEVTTRRLQFDLRKLEERIHILQAFEIIFNALDEAIALIRASDGKKDARDKLMERFALDYVQAEAILETKLYKLAKLEIDAIREELAEKEAQAAELRRVLGSNEEMWSLIRGELEQVRDAYGDKRRTRMTGPVEDLQFSEEVYIVAEDAFCMVSRLGWIKRQKSYTDMSAVRVREGDEIGWVVPCSSREALVFFTDRGKAYTMRATDVVMTTGYGDAIQTKFDFADGEKIIGVATTDDRVLPLIAEEMLQDLTEDDPIPPYVTLLSRQGKTLRVSIHAFSEPSTVKGRNVMRLDKTGDAVLAAYVSDGTEVVSLATKQGRCLLFPVDEIKVLSGSGKGVLATKLTKDDFVMGYVLTKHRMEGLEVETNRGRVEVVRPNKFTVTSRGNRGREIIRQGYLTRVGVEPVELMFRDEEPKAAEEEPLLDPPDSDQGELI